MALKALSQSKLLRNFYRGQCRLYEFSPKHRLCGQVRNIFDRMKEFELRERAKVYEQEAKNALVFVQSTNKVFKKISG
jgi:hypothetical protein